MPKTARSFEIYRLVLVAFGLLFVPALGGAQETPATATYYLLRHAEKADSSADPPLSPEGEERARGLVRTLSGVGVTHLHSTDYRRTRQTLGSLAELTGLEVEIYNPRDLTGFAARLREMDGVHVVVGHSNTTPELAELLGGDPGPAMDESEYGRLYVLVRDAEGSITSEIHHLPIDPVAAEPDAAEKSPIN